MKLITFITLIIVNCIVTLASPAWEHIVIDVSDGRTNGFRDDISYPEDFSIAAELNVEADCIKTVNAGAGAVLDEIYENDCALLSFSSGIITRDYKFNCCGESTWIRVNNKDWFNIKSQGKLDGLRFEQVMVDQNSRAINFYKVVDKQSTSIAGEQFFS